MRLRRRAAAAPVGPHAVYARILDGETLWLAVAGATSVALDGSDLDLAAHGDLLTGRVPLTGPGPLTTDGAPLPAADGALEQGPLATPPTRDGRWQYAVVADGGLRITRTERGPEVLLHDVRVEADALLISLRPRVGPLQVLDADALVAELPLVDGTARLRVDDVPDAPLLTLAVDGVPVRRARNALRFPGAAVVLPGLGDELSPHLRWLRDGRLALARTEESAP